MLLKMESTSTNLQKDGGVEENTVPVHGLISKGETIVPKRRRRILEPGRTLMLNIQRSGARAGSRELFVQGIHGFHSSIPKHITTLDEKYVLRCLELIRKCALRAAVRNFNSKVDIIPDVNNLAGIQNLSSNNMSRLAIESPWVVDSGTILNSASDWSIGTVSGSPSMINILKSPLLQKFGSFDSDVIFVRSDLLDASAPFCSSSSNFRQSPKKSSRSISFSLQEENDNDHTYVSQPVHKKDASSMSSTNSSSSDQSTTPISFQGMLQCTWKDQLPHHIFTVDDKQEVYTARLSNVVSSSGKGLDYIYTFYSRKNGKKDSGAHELDFESVAKMRVTTSISFSSNQSEVRETQFVISVSSNNQTGEMRTTNNTLKKNNRLTRKVADALRSGHASKHRSLSGHRGSGAIFEDTFWDPYENGHYNCQNQGDDCVDDKEAPNFELAAIIVRDIHNNHKKAEFGGWGLKFLKGPENNQSPETLESLKGSCNTKKCTSSMDILIPAGIHGGPRTRVGGPSSLIERWMSGGCCDCGGWDIGCPLTVLNSRLSCTDYAFSKFGDCQSIDLFMQGPNQTLPIMKMGNIHEGLYYIHFQPILSALQSFAIAAAVIHSQSPVLRPKVQRSRSDMLMD